MTISTNKSTTLPLPGNGVNKQFDFDFKTLDSTHIEVWFKDGDAGSVKLTTNYTVTLNADQDNNPGGNVTYPDTGDALTASQFVTILRAMPFTQETLDVAEGQAFSAPVVETGLDLATMERQELYEKIERTLTVVPGEDKPEDYLNQCEVARDAAEGFSQDSSGYADLSLGYANISLGYANTSLGYSNDSSDYADDSAASAAEAALIAATLPNAYPRHCVQSYGNGVNIDSTADVKGNEVLSEVGTGVARSIDFTLDMSSDNNGGMCLFKDKDSVVDWRLFASLLGVDGGLSTNTAAVKNSETNGVTAFDTDGCDVGTLANVNANTKNIAEFGFQTTHKKVRTFSSVKSVVFDFADTYGASTLGVRRIEFYDNTGALISLSTSTDYVAYATSEDVGYEADNAFDTSYSKIGTSLDTSYATATANNRRLIIVFTATKTISKIVINNFHNSGATTTAGVENTKIYTSTDSITSTVYGEIISNSELIFDGVIAQHTAVNQIEDKPYCGVEWAYNPATGFFMLTHDGDGSDFPIENVTGKSVIFSSTKNLDNTNSHLVYNELSGLEKYMSLDTTAAVTTLATVFNEMSETQLLLGTNISVNGSGYRYFTWGFVGEDLGSITPGMQGIEGSVSIHTLNGGGTYDCGIDESNVQSILLKQTNGTSNWSFKNSVSGYTKELYLNGTNIELTQNTITFSGSNIIVPTSFSGDWIVLVVGKTGDMPTGKTINITADSDNPFVATIADGFSSITGQKDWHVAEASNKQLGFTEGDGDYILAVDNLKNYTLETTRPEVDSTPGTMRQADKKVPIADVTVLDGDIVDLDLMPVGNYYESEWFPVTINTLYELKNRFQDLKIDVEIWWNSTAVDSGMRKVSPVYVSTSGSTGAVAKVEADKIEIGTGTLYTYYTSFGGESINSTGGYYKILVRRDW